MTMEAAQSTVLLPNLDSRRSCTDIICCILLAILVIAMFIFGIYCWSTSNFSKLTTPYDGEGKGCGSDYPNFPYIYFVAPSYDVPLHLHRLFGGLCV
jgi:hypothetical protein